MEPASYPRPILPRSEDCSELEFQVIRCPSRAAEEIIPASTSLRRSLKTSVRDTGQACFLPGNQHGINPGCLGRRQDGLRR